MKNPLKEKSLTYILLGVLTTLGLVFAVEMFDSHSVIYKAPASTKDLPYHGLKENANGDVLITKKGKCYHSLYGCSSLSRSKNLRKVSYIDADKAGIKPCKKCNPLNMYDE